MKDTVEGMRLQSSEAVAWRRWGPYVSERQWGTVREDYSSDGSVWSYFSHDQARSRAYRWGEDGLLGLCDDECRLAFGVALWNGRDPILKERLFGLTGPEGNHGEDVKELYYYLDATPTHSWLEALYKYPQATYPYNDLVEENRRRGFGHPEYEVADTGVFDEERYFDVRAQYGKKAPDDILLRLRVTNQGPETSTIHVLPQIWFRNTWSWGPTAGDSEERSILRADGPDRVLIEDAGLGRFTFGADVGPNGVAPTLLFTENDTNVERLFGGTNPSPYVKDAFHRYVIEGDGAAVNPARTGTKAAAHYVLTLAPGEEAVLKLRIRHGAGRAPRTLFGGAFDRELATRRAEANAFHAALTPTEATVEETLVQRQARAGLLWTKQFYYYDIPEWLRGDPGQPPPSSRLQGRNADWKHLNNKDIISMPDKWEYPWYAAWDLAFHMIPFAGLDPQFAKDQLVLFLREWYMHPNGQIPAYEFAFGDVNPPVHAWACWRVYKMTGSRGGRDRVFLARTFQKLMINFTWWVNRKDVEGNHLFSGGFLGLDNIGVFDRSRPLPTGGHLEQADGTAWMAFYSATMLSMALELAKEDRAYEDVATKFFEHFVAIADAMNTLGGTGLWDEDDGFYYDQLHADGKMTALRVRSLVGMVPLVACEVLEADTLDRLPGFRRRLEWLLKNRPDLGSNIALCTNVEDGHHGNRLLALPTKERLTKVVRYLLDEEEFLSPYGIRSVSKVHAEHPYVFGVQGEEYRVDYVPGEGTSGAFGGNSNWRGPIWFPLNYLLIEALERYHHFYGEGFRVECPVGSGQFVTLQGAAQEIARRLAGIFLPDASGARPCHGGDPRYTQPAWRDLVLFHEYFHADTGRGIGASHQTGWTALVAKVMEETARTRATDAPALGKTSPQSRPRRKTGMG